MIKQEELITVAVAEKSIFAGPAKSIEQGMNTMCKGSKVSGNLVVSQDLQMMGDIEGNITAENNANIVIKGSCKGNIDAKGGSVEIEGEMSGGNINAGGSVKVTGKFLGGKIQAKDRIHVNGEFTGSLESSEVELGPSAHGKGEILYRETLSIQKGAKVEGKVTRAEAMRPPAPERKPERIEDLKPKRKGFFAS